MYFTSPLSIKSTEGSFELHVNAFSPILSVIINDKTLANDYEEFEFSLR